MVLLVVFLVLCVMSGLFGCILGSVRGATLEGFISSVLNRSGATRAPNQGHMHSAMATTSSATRPLMRLNYDSSPVVGIWLAWHNAGEVFIGSV